MSDESPEVQDTNDTDLAIGGHFPVFQQLSVALGILVLVFGGTYVSKFTSHKDIVVKEPQKTITPAPQKVARTAHSFDAFKDVVLEARSAYVWDVKEQRVLYSKDADESLPLASLTKLMTTLVAYELIGNNHLIDISVDAIREDGDSGLKEGETFSFNNLTDLTLITSSNDGAHALAAEAASAVPGGSTGTEQFIAAMNIRAKEIGLTQTHFRSVTGLDLSKTEAGAYGSARDITSLTEYILAHYPGLLAETPSKTKEVANTAGGVHTVENTNTIVGDIQGLIASKTGYTDLAGGNLMIAYNAGLDHPVIITVLGSSFDGRFSDVSELAKRSREQILNAQ